MFIHKNALLSRRDFLKLSGVVAASLLAAPLVEHVQAQEPSRLLGRVTASRLNVRQGPSFQSPKVGLLQRDTVVEIQEQVWGGIESDYNRLWYRIDEERYVYSGYVQPVQPRTNSPLETLAAPTLGEVTIPFVDSLWGLNRKPRPGPRLYYSSTHWVTDVVEERGRSILWYQCLDTLWNTFYYVPAAALYLYRDEELAPLSADIPEEEKYIEIVLDEQRLYAYEGDRLVYQARTATGRRGYETPLGEFKTFHKRPTYHMTGGSDARSVFDLPGVPWDTYITANGVAIHGTYWHNDFGTTHSHGCINLRPQDARWIYLWTTPVVPPHERLALTPGKGTRVRVVQRRETFPQNTLRIR
ncbi:MAG: L,D-transpeptidase family protein [Anaerolineales bacterium]|nr:L,D-transpeptidase family protein [Anaerolineales bacterium]MCX7607776.1 L,D-transpeptidase family protein [Anaerolineales bacterium]MDW8227016.1 L,D-transpeptidase family protein [Anaerolineales bacterium]